LKKEYFNGHGTLTYTDGTTWAGEWVNDQEKQYLAFIFETINILGIIQTME
jgi:hypothetical protein